MPLALEAQPTPSPVVLFSRYRDGAVPIKVIGEGKRRTFEMPGPDGVAQTFGSARTLLKTLRGRDLHWTLDRYARIGKHAPLDIPGAPVLDLPALDDIVIDIPVIGEQAVQVTTSELAILTSRKTAVTPVPVPLGIDLEKRGHEVAKLLFAGFGQLIFASHYDPDEVLQEVYRGILARNAGRCAWDARKSSFGHYVHMVCSCVLKNWHRREARYRSMEKTGLPCFGECGERTSDDVAAIAHDPTAHDTVYRSEESAADDLTQFIVAQGPSGDAMLALTLLPHVRAGRGRTEIAIETGLAKPVVSRGLTYLRDVARRWMAGK